MGQSIEDVKTLTIRVIDHMCKTPLDKGYGSNEFKSIIHLFDRSFFAIENPQNVVEDYRLWIASSVLSSGDYPHRLTQIFIDLGEYSFRSSECWGKIFEQYIELLSSFQLTLCNYLELSELLAEKISMQDAYLKEIYRIYEAILPHDGTYGKEKKITLVVEIIIKTLYNMLQHENPTISSALKKYNLIDIFIYYAKSTNTSLQIASYLSLAYIYNEEEQLIPEAVRMLTICVPFLIIFTGLRLLISNDQNGQFLCQSPILQSIQCTIKTLKGKVLEEVILFLLKLTFNSGIRDRIRRDFEVVLKDLDAFFKTKESETSSNIKRALNSILWQMSQDNMRYAVNTFRSLAEAVEKSYAVCIIYSENYKNSEYAEMEATYAVFLKKPIICLRAQRDYKPKGWLGLITARENRIDISGKYPFDEYFPNLCRRIDECIKIKTDHCS
ncbi:LOW QUALITY PROTEIN: hypothetical protein Smp_121580 [Schistosoma mansoni]|uniref:hypothetical protein n=1 Tax=Schistosoma mansoni TaxID=6183 RepID=UPI00022DC28B|nr:LOW QUALITY PROTEIN: hypothetical protein Smp_121580 [Schistosoma mansoni]|eukprot:XP_018649775.1 LOW QUALITY PROTEIN: hypothetical protein Smp_121580 [Schistosoma mansoni]